MALNAVFIRRWENSLIKKISFEADVPENVTVGVPGENEAPGNMLAS